METSEAIDRFIVTPERQHFLQVSILKMLSALGAIDVVHFMTSAEVQWIQLIMGFVVARHGMCISLRVRQIITTFSWRIPQCLPR
jgi:hypothetical protein